MNNKKSVYEIHKLILNDNSSNSKIITKFIFSGENVYKIHKLVKENNKDSFIKIYTVNDLKDLIK